MTTYTITQAAPSGYGSIVAVASDESGGAVQRLAWQNITALGGITKEFVNNTDHGRLLSLSCTTNTADSEAYNPTQGGSVNDGYITNPSTSRLLSAKATGNVLETVTQMAFWKPVAGVKRSNYILKQKVTLGYKGIWNAIAVDETLYTPENEQPAVLQFEELTMYMPPEFSVFQTLNRATHVLSPLSDGPGEQPLPIVISTPDAQWASGIWAPNGLPGGGYGRWRFADCTKWNAVSRTTNPVAGQTYARHLVLAVGSQADVVSTLCGLTG